MSLGTQKVDCVSAQSASCQPVTEEYPNGPFEGPEKLLELWFAPSADEVPIDSNVGSRPGPDSANASTNRKFTGLRTVQHELWHSMLDEVKCKVLSVIESEEVDAFLLSESSMFVWPHKIILKTCGTTGLLLGLDTLLKIAKEVCGFSGAWRWFYSRKAFMFPAQQSAPHTSWEDETKFLDQRFAPHATAQVLGENPWYLYHRTAPPRSGSAPAQSAIVSTTQSADIQSHETSQAIEPDQVGRLSERDYTLEILMTGLSSRAASHFESSDDLEEGHDPGMKIAMAHGLDATSLLGSGETDAYLFSPCGFSANLVGGPDKKRYGTIHVTPELSHSFASFETNVDYTNRHQDLRKLISRILKTFEPKKTTITLFISHSEDNSIYLDSHSDLEQRMDQLLEEDLRSSYRLGEQKDHELDDYNLAYISLERREDLE
ncbi:hypothetical protein KEM48_007622 [Puccinia striiformis f. sp. tritici PST-130]|nr:hypothetical protein KEM48_007622 [Puccinia striiformis f. sp. tritici PST-130]